MKKYFLFFLPIIFNSSFVYSNNLNEFGVKSFWALNTSVVQGGIIIFQINSYWLPPVSQDPTIFIFGEHYRPNSNGKVVVGVGLDVKPSKYQAFFYENGIWRCCDLVEVEVLETKFEQTRISVYSNKPNQRRDYQKINIDRVFKEADENDNKNDFTKGVPYVSPLALNAEIIDPFGFIYKNNPYRKHEGVDLKVPVNTPVVTINSGRVVMTAKNYRREGNMIIISHGLSIFSVYMHLSNFNVKSGDFVEKGQIIGFSGESGKGVREPHLHFSVKIKNYYINPISFIELVNLSYK